MTSAIELGRGVIRSLTAQLEVELVTSITVSPPRDAIDLQQLHDPEILTLILSQNAWITGGKQFHFVLDLSIHGRPVTFEEKAKLAGKIITAPVWKQLNLIASLPPTFQNEPSSSDNGTIQIDINHNRDFSGRLAKNNHRIGSGTSPFDVKPPNGIPRLELNRVHFLLTLKKVKTKRQNDRKRLKPNNEQHSLTGTISDSLFNEPDETISENLFEFPPSSDDSDLFQERYNLLTDLLHNSYDGIFEAQEPIASIPKRPMAMLDTESVSECLNPIEEGDLATLVDAAIRISISKNPRRFPSNTKLIKANFIARLADISPALWGPNHLLALSQRAPFLPILSHSLSRSVYTKARSLSLRSKLETLQISLPCSTQSTVPSGHGPLSLNSSTQNLTSRIESSLWIFTQKHLRTQKAARHLKPFMSLTTSTVLPSHSDDVLEDYSQHDEILASQEADWLQDVDDEDLERAVDDEDSDCDLHRDLPDTIELDPTDEGFIEDTDYISDVDLLDPGYDLDTDGRYLPEI